MEYEPLTNEDKKSQADRKDPRAIGGAVVAPGVIGESAHPAANHNSLTAFQKLLQGDPTARTAVLGLPPLTEVEAKPQHRPGNDADNEADKAPRHHQAPKRQAESAKEFSHNDEVSLQPNMQPRSLGETVRHESKEHGHDEPPTSPPPLTAWMQSGGESRPSGLAVPAGVETAYERTKPSADWTHSELSKNSNAGLSAERLSSAPVEELIALPAGATANSFRKAPEKSADSVQAKAETKPDKAEMEHLAKTIKIDGVSLQEIFDSKQIDREGLQAIIQTYLRGGDIRKHLNQEIIEKQKQYERDPMNRKRSDGQLSGKVSKASTILATKSADFAKTAQQAAGKAGKSIAKNAKQAQTKLADRSDAQLWAGIAAIVVIYATILLLLFG